MGENENETEDTTPGRKVSRRAFLASGAALGGVVVWGAAGAPANAASAPPIAGQPPAILNTGPLYPPILPGVTGSTGIIITTVAPDDAGTPPPTADTPGAGAQGSPTSYTPDNGRDSSGGSSGGGGGGFFKFRFRAPNPF